ncbi:MAG: ribosome rescue protein RqcH [Caldisphaera sp.]
MARKSMSTVDIYSWINTTGKKLVGQRVDNIYQEDELILIKIKIDVGDMLLVEPSNRIHYTQRIKPSKEFNEKQFVLLLRKYTRDLRVTDVKQLGFDRVISFTFSNNFKLYAELLPRGVSVLVDDNNFIIGGNKYIRFKDREIKIKKEYRLPSLINDKPWELSYGAIDNQLRKFKDVIRGLVLGLNLPGEVAEEVVYLSGIKKDEDPNKLETKDIESLLINLNNLIKESLLGKGYIGYSLDNEPIQVTPFKPKSLIENNLNVSEYNLFDNALDEYFNTIVKVKADVKLEEEKEKILHSIEENKVLANQFLEESKKLEEEANIIASNYSYFNQILHCIKEYLNKKDKICDAVKKIDFKERYALINYENDLIKIYYDEEGLDKSIVRLYKEAGELKSKSKRALKSIEDMQLKLSEIQSKLILNEIKQKIRNRKREWYEKYHWVITKNNLLAIGGKDADQNESIVKKYLRDKDIFIHADIHGSPAVVLFNEEEKANEEDIYDAAIITVAYSKAWKGGMGGLRAYWVYGNQVSKSPPSGEYLAKGSFMIYGKKNILKQFDMQIFVGIALNSEGLPVIISGNENIVKEQSLVYAKLIPGNFQVLDIAKKIKEMAEKIVIYEYKSLIVAIDDNEISQRIPGKSQIVFVKNGENKKLKTIQK